MKNLEAQSAAKMRDEKKQLIEAAARDIENIQLTGRAIRAQIDVAKEIALTTIEEDKSQEILNDTCMAVEQSELIRQIADAAKFGNFTEMRRLKELLDGSKLNHNT